MHEHIITAFVALNEAEAFCRVEELYSALALSNDLGRHTAATGAAAAAETAAATATLSAAETTAAVITTAETIAAAATEAVTAATETVLATKTILTAEERIEIVLSEPIPLVASPSATTSIKTHL
ncbi:hypothetical protein GCM10011349_08060 [Novosphingobium indicum]|uniref:Uncharacterized protein n=1 Tax=Novosphingobium indicum TaxID=462949 RepID=A0ABQ2JDQ2_9SPHN|nr:hypothetical protein GCM10011349_08060 [Novosphingobium indicum]